MIGNITTGTNFKGLFSYLLKESKQANILGGEHIWLQNDVNKLSAQFKHIAQFRPSTQKPVKHISIGFAPDDGEVNQSIKLEIAKEIVNKLGYNNNQWIVIEHQRDDSDHDWKHKHDHIHLVINGINLDHKRVKDSFDKTRLEKILRKLEKEKQLTQVESSKKKDLSRIKSSQLRKYQRETNEFKQKKRSTPPDLPTMAILQSAIDACSCDRPDLKTFLGRLQHLGIEPKPYISDKGRKRISYSYKGINVKGSKLHNGSFPKLIKKRGITFSQTSDSQTIRNTYKGIKINLPLDKLFSWKQINESKVSATAKLPQAMQNKTKEKDNESEVKIGSESLSSKRSQWLARDLEI